MAKQVKAKHKSRKGREITKATTIVCYSLYRQSAEIEEALIIPRLVKLLVFRNSADCFCETIPLQGKLSCLVNMLDDTTHGFGIQIGALVPPQLTAPLGFTACNFASTRFANP